METSTSSLGLFIIAADAGKLGIGVDKNQNHLQSGSVLTSMIKRVDLAVYNIKLTKFWEMVQQKPQKLQTQY